MKEQILSCLPADYPWKDRLCWFDSIDSTNDEAKKMALRGAPHGTVLIADHQTVGHGRLGRSFHSPEGVGIYMTILLRPDCAPGELMHLTCAAGVAMCDAVEAAAGFRPGIKWTNDLVFGDRKLGGILTGMGLTRDGKVDYAIIGIGINCCQTSADFPEEIAGMAASLAIVSGEVPDRAKVAGAMMEALWKMDAGLLSEKKAMLERYRRDCITLHRDVVLVRGDEKRYGHALDIDEEGALIVRYDSGEVAAVNSGEISVRGMYGYA